MEEERRKVYVEVDVTHKTDGTARPCKALLSCGIDQGRWNRASLHGDDMRYGNLPFR